MDTKLPPTFWTDPDFDNLKPEVLLAVVWIKTNDRLNLLGFAEISPRVFTFQSRMPFDVFERACVALGEGLVREGNKYWLRDFICEQIGTGLALVRNNMRKPLVRALSLVDSPSIKAEILKEYPELSDSDSHSLPEGVGKPKSRAEKSREEKSREEKSREEQSRAEQGVQGGATPGARRSGASRPADCPEPFKTRMIAVADIMRRRPDSAWNEGEKKALAAAGLLDVDAVDFEEQVAAMKAFYQAKVPESKQRDFWKRSTLPTLLNNWPSELDKARAWRLASGGAGDGVTKVA